MMGTKDNSNLYEILKNKENKENKIDQERTITRRDKARLAKAVAKMHEKLGDDRVNLLAIAVVTAAKRKEEKGEKFTFEDLERVLKKAIEMVNEI